MSEGGLYQASRGDVGKVEARRPVTFESYVMLTMYMES